MNRLTPGKARALARMSRDGIFTMLAIDQRPILADMLAKARGVERSAIRHADLAAVKRLITEVLSPEASATLVDPLHALPDAISTVPASTGLMVTLEDAAFIDDAGGRKSRAIPGWSVGKTRRIGADGVKLLVWWRPDARRDVVEHQRAFVLQVGDACKRHDIAFVLELLVYAGGRTPELSQPLDADRRAAFVRDGVTEFGDTRYGVDLFKLESPRHAETLPAYREGRRDADLVAVGELCATAGRPWAMLSGGVDAAAFENMLRHAFAAGCSGFLAGRSFWAPALAHFPDLDRVRDALIEGAKPHLARMRIFAARHAQPFTATTEASASEAGAFVASYAEP